MESFHAVLAVDSVVARRCGDFPFKAVSYPQDLNQVAVELA